MCALCVEACIVRCMCVYVCAMVLCMCFEGTGGLPWCWLACKIAPVERGGWPISTAEMSLSAHWELSQSVTDTCGTVHVI